MTAVSENDQDKSNVFPRPGTGYYGSLQDPDYAPKHFTRLKYWNKIIVPLYRLRILPLFGAGRILYVMTTKGRKTGKKRRTPLELIRIDDKLYGGVSLPWRSQWYKNLLASPDDVWVQLGFRSFHARVEFLNDEESIEFFKWYSLNKPKLAKVGWGWDPERDDVETADFSQLLIVYKLFRIHRYDNDQKEEK